MTQKQTHKALADVFYEVIQPLLFEAETEDLRLQIICEFVEKCAELGHGVQAEAIVEYGNLKGVSYIHENGYEGELRIQVEII